MYVESKNYPYKEKLIDILETFELLERDLLIEQQDRYEISEQQDKVLSLMTEDVLKCISILEKYRED